LQSDLLRVICDREVRPVGGDRPRPIDVRILASTHRDLPRLVAQGDFREDLYQRLKVGELTVPSLSERPEDVAPLTDYFMRCHAEHLDVEVPLLGPEVRRRLAELPWPGNVRELRDTLERLVALGRGAELTIQDLNEALDAAPREMGLRDRVEAYERAQIVEELERVSGRRAEAARRLHLARGTLLSKMKKYGL
ncbi:MAG: sigma-54-dependent Fis family transcriptional regulator, partial [Deltaproteobacteria bacterium]|nr:sigma-54-dependent Fis family transcriptional regulator [Deltaproteobacteria bacterium]